MQLVLDNNGLTLKKRNNSFWVIHKKGRRLISPHRVSSIAVTRNCLISTAAIRLAAKHQIPIFFFTAAGKSEAQLRSAGFGSIATVRRLQVLAAETPLSTQIIIECFQLKTDQQIEILRALARNQIPIAQWQTTARFLQQQKEVLKSRKSFPMTEVRPQLLGIEGSMARQYWALIGTAVGESWHFATRSRRPALDPFNAVLNYWYGMLYNVVENAVLAAGLDPYLGFFHVDEYKRPTLVFDLIEPFRPWIDQLLIYHTLQNEPLKTHFEPKDQGIYLSKAGRMVYIPLFNDFMEAKITFQDRRLSRKNHIHYFAGQLAQRLLRHEKDLSG